MNKKIFISFAIIALVVQIFPVWWFTALMSYWFFFIEAIFEGGLFRGSLEPSIIFLTGIFSAYSILALISSIWSFFSVRGLEPEEILSKKRNNLFLIINILTIIILLVLIILNKGILPRL